MTTSNEVPDDTDAPIPEATNKYVAFCDVLGFSNAVLNRFDETISVYANFIGRMRRWPIPDKVVLSMYSDSILLVSDDLHPMLQALQSLWFATLSQDWMIRGGVAYGKYWEHRENGNVYVVSDALVRAVKIESTVGIPAIAFSDDIAIGPEVWITRFKHDIYTAPVLHYDRLNVVNPFNRYWFASAKMRAATLLAEFPEHQNKYKWFLGLADAVGRDETLIPQDVLDDFLKMGVLKKPDS